MNKIHKFTNLSNLVTFLKNEAQSNLLVEICGLISFKNNSFFYKRMNNISCKADFFKISPKEYLDFIREYNCFCIFHSHLSGSENPSDIDILNSNNCCKAFLIYSNFTENFHIYEPEIKDYDVNLIKEFKNFI